MGFKREFFPFLLMLFVLLPTGYYFAGSIVYNEVAKTNTDCWGNFDQNIPTQFAPLRNEVPLNESQNSENITANIMENISGDKLNESSVKSAVEEISKKNLSKYL